MISSAPWLAVTVITAALLWVQPVRADEVPLTTNKPISEFQNRVEDVTAYDFDAPPQGMFRSITMAENFEERLGVHRAHEIVPVKPTQQFSSTTSAVFIVFSLHQHYQGFTIFGRCLPELAMDIVPGTIVSEDAAYVALEDESGYLTLPPPHGGWRPGRYKVEIHAGEQVNEMSLMGTMRFTIMETEP